MKVSKEKLDLAMARKSYSLERLAEESGLSLNTIKSVRSRRGDSRPQTIGLIADALGVAVDEIVEKGT